MIDSYPPQLIIFEHFLGKLTTLASTTVEAATARGVDSDIVKSWCTQPVALQVAGLRLNTRWTFQTEIQIAIRAF